VFSYRGNVGLATQPEHFGGLRKTDSRKTGDVVAAGEDARIAELVERVQVWMETHCLVQVTALHQNAIAIYVHLEHDLSNDGITNTISTDQPAATN